MLCTYDSRDYGSFETGLIMVEGALIGTTEFDIFSIDPATCAQNWRTHEDYPAYILPVNRGAAYLDGMLFRGTEDGRVLGYDFKTGKRLWATTIADPKKGETVPAAPIAWEGLVFIGNAGGDEKGGKGRMYALDAKTGSIVWEFYLVPKSDGDPVRGPQGASPLENSTWKNVPGVPITGAGTWTSYTLDPKTGLLYVPGGNPGPDFNNSVRGGDNLFTDSVVVLDAKTGAYKNHFQLVPKDWHDWDVSNPPALIRTMGGKRLMAVAPKDGYLYGFDLADNKLVYKTPVTKIENVDRAVLARTRTSISVRVQSAARNGAAWASHPRTNLILTVDVDWCTTVKVQTKEELVASAAGQPWLWEASLNPSQPIRKAISCGRVLGGMGSCSRCRHRRLEMAAQDQLSDRRREAYPVVPGSSRFSVWAGWLPRLARGLNRPVGSPLPSYAAVAGVEPYDAAARVGTADDVPVGRRLVARGYGKYGSRTTRAEEKRRLYPADNSLRVEG